VSDRPGFLQHRNDLPLGMTFSGHGTPRWAHDTTVTFLDNGIVFGGKVRKVSTIGEKFLVHVFANERPPQIN
jgi:hypothetical protein